MLSAYVLNEHAPSTLDPGAPVSSAHEPSGNYPIVYMQVCACAYILSADVFNTYMSNAYVPSAHAQGAFDFALDEFSL